MDHPDRHTSVCIIDMLEDLKLDNIFGNNTKNRFWSKLLCPRCSLSKANTVEPPCVQ